MRLPKCFWLISTLMIGVSVSAGQTAYQQAVQPSPAVQRDLQAITLLNQAAVVDGGLSALNAVTDYKASGRVTYQIQNQQIEGTVTISGQGLQRFRFDENLSTGVRSLAINLGKMSTKTENGLVRVVRSPAPFTPASFLLPSLHLRLAAKNTSLNLIYKGMVQAYGRSFYEVRVQRVLPSHADPGGLRAQYLQTDVFVDASTSQVAMTKDVVPKGLARTLRYSDYRSVSGVLVPFSIDEEVEGTRIRVIQLDQVTFNQGLQDSAFDLSK